MLLRWVLTPTGMAFDRMLVRWLGFSLLCTLIARQNGLPATPTLILETLGHKSGQKRSVALSYFTLGETLFAVGSNGGGPTDPLWVTNLRSNPQGRIILRRRSRPITARIAAAAERERLWRAAIATVPTYATYQTMTDREIPVVILQG